MKKEHGTAQQSAVIQKLEEVMQRSETQVIRYLESTAELCFRGQQHLLESVIKWVSSLQGHVVPVCYIQHETLDETPLRVRVSYQQEDTGGVAQIAKIYVAESQWCMLVKDTVPGEGDEYCLLHGRFSPRVVSANCSTSSAIAAVMQQTPRATVKAEEVFGRRVRILEQDEGAANPKAARMFASTLQREWSEFTWYCTGHKAHTVSEKVMLLAKPALTGTVNTLLAMQTSQQLGRLELVVDRLVKERLIMSTGKILSEQAVVFRKNILEQFLCDGKSGRKRASMIVLAGLLNGDWRRDDVLEHICSSSECCRSREHACEKISWAIRHVLKTCRGSSLCRDNWLEWRRPISVVGLLLFAHASPPSSLCSGVSS